MISTSTSNCCPGTLVPKHPQLELVKIANARMLVLDDQPEAADDAIAAFVKKI